MQCSVLIISSTDKGRAVMQTLVTEGNSVPKDCKLCKSGSEARQLLGQSDWELIVINMPLSDESGLELAMEMAESTLAGILLLVRAEQADLVAERCEKAGVMVIAKPISRPLFEQAMRFSSASRRRLLALREENVRLERRLAEQRFIDRAKCVLIQHHGITEEQAHRLIEKQAMDTRQTKLAVAKLILAANEV